MLALEGLRVRYGPLEALHGVTLDVAAGSLTLVLGRNGAGKTSLLRAIAGNVRASGGRTLWQGTDITRHGIGRRAAEGIMLVPDDGGVFRALTVQENLELFSGGTPVDAALETFPQLEGLLKRRAGLLSGGEQQMLALSRALLAPWRLLLVDELSHGLAPVVADRLYAVLAGLAENHRDRAILLAEPHAREGVGVGGQVCVVRRGEVVFTGAAADVDPEAL
jgi:branched-chain amino acid transport system ATP-binding protein